MGDGECDYVSRSGFDELAICTDCEPDDPFTSKMKIANTDKEGCSSHDTFHCGYGGACVYGRAFERNGCINNVHGNNVVERYINLHGCDPIMQQWLIR